MIVMVGERGLVELFLRPGEMKAFYLCDLVVSIITFIAIIHKYM